MSRPRHLENSEREVLSMILVNAPTDSDAPCPMLPAVMRDDVMADAVVQVAATVTDQPSRVGPKAPTANDGRYRTNRHVLIRLVAKVLREETQKQGVRQTTIASRMGRQSSASVCRLLSGDHNVSLSTIADLATALGKRVQITLVDDVLARPARSAPTTWNLALRNVHTQQALLYLPKDIASIPVRFQAEFNQPSIDTLILTFVEPNVPARVWDRRYKVQRRNGSIWTSVPRPWLRDQAREGDSLRVTRLWPRSFAIKLIRASRT